LKKRLNGEREGELEKKGLVRGRFKEKTNFFVLQWESQRKGGKIKGKRRKVGTLIA